MQYEGKGEFKIFTETGMNEPSAEEVVEESKSFLKSEEFKHVSFSNPEQHQLSTKTEHRENVTSETNVSKCEKLSYIQEDIKGKNDMYSTLCIIVMRYIEH